MLFRTMLRYVRLLESCRGGDTRQGDAGGTGCPKRGLVPRPEQAQGHVDGRRADSRRLSVRVLAVELRRPDPIVRTRMGCGPSAVEPLRCGTRTHFRRA